MFDHMLESSYRDDSRKWSDIGFTKEVKQIVSIEVNFTHHIWSTEGVSRECFSPPVGGGSQKIIILFGYMLESSR